MNQVIVTGSIAYDNLFSYEGEFQNDISVNDLNKLSVSFLAKNHQIFFGGCGANIAYNLKLLGISSDLYGVLGNDADRYLNYLRKLKIDTGKVAIDKLNSSSAAFILSDFKQNQISFFSVGAMENLELCMSLSNVENQEWIIVSPDMPERMLSFCKSAIEKKLKLVFDPGQQVNQFLESEMRFILSNAFGLVLNQYESVLLEKKLNLEIPEILNEFGLNFIVVTKGENGCELFSKEKKSLINALKIDNPIDSTGAGDAFRAGLLYGLITGSTLEDSCKYGNSVASFVVENFGTQKHVFTFEEFRKRSESIS